MVNIERNILFAPDTPGGPETSVDTIQKLIVLNHGSQTEQPLGQVWTDADKFSAEGALRTRLSVSAQRNLALGLVHFFAQSHSWRNAEDVTSVNPNALHKQSKNTGHVADTLTVRTKLATLQGKIGKGIGFVAAEVVRPEQDYRKHTVFTALPSRLMHALDRDARVLYTGLVPASVRIPDVHPTEINAFERALAYQVGKTKSEKDIYHAEPVLPAHIHNYLISILISDDGTARHLGDPQQIQGYNAFLKTAGLTSHQFVAPGENCIKLQRTPSA